jgi:hypothetical protein
MRTIRIVSSTTVVSGEKERVVKTFESRCVQREREIERKEKEKSEKCFASFFKERKE